MILHDLSFPLPKPEVLIVSSSNILNFIFITGSNLTIFVYNGGHAVHHFKELFTISTFWCKQFWHVVGNFNVLLTILHQNQNRTNGLKPFECQR